MKDRRLIFWVLIFAVVYLISFSLLPKLFFARGKAMHENGKHASAAKYFGKALVMKPQNPDYRYYYIKSVAELKPAYNVQRIMYEYSQNGNDSASILANEKVNEWKANINQNIGNNYIDQAPSDSNIIRWNKSSFPLKVYIDLTENLPDYYKSSVTRAINQWEKSVNFISFVESKNKNNAQIVINFKDLPENVCTSGVCKYVAGYTNPKVSGKTLKKMVITIYNKNPKGEYFSDKEIYNTVLHELGHALGIMGHSYSTDDLMAPQIQEHNSIFSRYRSDFHYLTGNDVNTINLLYMLEPSITDKNIKSVDGLIYTPIILGSPEESAAKKVKEALAYIKNSPELSVGYINLAGAYADLKEYNKALEALENALDTVNTDNEKFIIYYNFAYVYMNLKQYDTALKYAELAKEIEPSPDVLELIGVIENNRNIKK